MQENFCRRVNFRQKKGGVSPTLVTWCSGVTATSSS